MRGQLDDASKIFYRWYGFFGDTGPSETPDIGAERWLRARKLEDVQDSLDPLRRAYLDKKFGFTDE